MTTDLDNRVSKIESLLHGNGGEGLIDRVKRTEDILDGDGKEFGVHTKVAILWRAHMWAFCTASGLVGTILGAAGTLILQQIGK